jgi:hypothetical protein
VNRFGNLAVYLGPNVKEADWNRRRETIRGLIERIEIGRESLTVIFQTPHGMAISNQNPVTVTLNKGLEVVRGRCAAISFACEQGGAVSGEEPAG